MKKVAIIDTGRDEGNTRINNKAIYDINFKNDLDSKDVIGHGTALLSLYQDLFPNVKIYSAKVFDGYSTKVETVIEALEYIYNNLEVDLINFSIGIHKYSKEFEEICFKLYRKGVVLLAAFDNDGYLSYPAAFDFTIGVSNSTKITNLNEYILVENSPIDILGYSGSQVVDWLNNKKKIVVGNSFILPYIAKYILNKSKDKLDKMSIKALLGESALQTITFKKNIAEAIDNRKLLIKKIEKAIVFPINKETLNLLNNREVLKFEITDIFDFKYSTRLGRKINDFLHKKDTADAFIRSISSLNWLDNFDTFILGHIKETEQQLNKDIFKEILEKCIKYKKNLVFFDDIDSSRYIKTFENNNCFIYSPNLDINIESNTFGELWYVNNPVLCVAGTSSRQGKFNVQVELGKALKKEGYKIGQIGTEPNSELLNFDYTYPNGYGTKKVFTDSKEIMFFNQLAYSLHDNDLIIVGTQSQLIPYSQGHINAFPLLQRNVLSGTQPDAMILCVNPFDSSEYIKRTISYVEAFHEIIVIAIVVYPLEKKVDHITSEYSERILTNKELMDFINDLNKELKIPAFVNGKDIDKLMEVCINFFS